MQDRSHETRAVLLKATSERLWLEDDFQLRISDICSDTSLSSSAIYSNLRSRQGLIDATLLQIYDEVCVGYETALSVIMNVAKSTDEIIEQLIKMNEAPGRNYGQMRLRITTAALSRKKFREGFSKIRESHLANLEVIYANLQRRQVISAKLDARQLALFFEGFNYARAGNELNEHPESNGGWFDMLHLLLDAD